MCLLCYVRPLANFHLPFDFSTFDFDVLCFQLSNCQCPPPSFIGHLKVCPALNQSIRLLYWRCIIFHWQAIVISLIGVFFLRPFNSPQYGVHWFAYISPPCLHQVSTYVFLHNSMEYFVWGCYHLMFISSLTYSYLFSNFIVLC